MKLLRFLILLILTFGLTWFLNTNNPLGTPLPALGKLLSPFQGVWQNSVNENNLIQNLKSKKITNEEIKILYDENLVPHIFATNTEDALFAQGYVHAQHRLWQMDITVRSAGGELSEVMGERTLELDKLMRRRGLRLSAENAIESWKKGGSWNTLEAYVAGVNAYINSLSPKDYPIEFKLLDYEPTEWTPMKTALFVRIMALNLNFRNADIAATNTLNLLGQDVYDFLFPDWNPKQSPIIPVGTAWAADSVVAQLPIDSSAAIGTLLPYTQQSMPDEGIGSNNWAVAGSKTASGNPILCSDPHLGLSLPSIWYQVQIHTPEINAYGASLPGVPWVTIGFNENIAWGQTNVGQDLADWYRIEWANEEKNKYVLDGASKDIDYRIEEIKVRGKSTVIDSVKYTLWGPIVYEEEGSDYQDLALRWLSHDAPNPEELSSFFKLNKAKNYDEYVQALEPYGIPAQNFVFASREGDIALRVNGDFPIKKEGQGKFVQEGNTSENAWQGIIPKTQIPAVKNPERGFVASANQHSTDPSYPYYYNGGFDDYRGRIINRELAKMDSVTIQDMMNLQTSNKSLFAEEGLSLLLQHLNRSELTPVEKGLVKILEDWNYSFDDEEVAPALFTEWYEQFEKLLWDEIDIYRDSINLIDIEKWRTLQLLEQEPLAVFWDIKSTPEREDRSAIVTQSFLKMEQKLGEKLADKSYNWLQHKPLNIAHISKTIRPFGRYNVPAGGYGLAPNANKSTHGPSWRMVVELGEEVKAYGVYPGGQSGNPASPYYDNMIDKWAAGEYYELFFMKDANDTRQPILFTQTISN